MRNKVAMIIGTFILGTVFGVVSIGLVLKDEYKIAQCTLAELGSVVYMETSGYVSPNYAEFRKAAEEFYFCAQNSFEKSFDTKTMLEPVDFRQ